MFRIKMQYLIIFPLTLWIYSLIDCSVSSSSPDQQKAKKKNDPPEKSNEKEKIPDQEGKTS